MVPIDLSRWREGNTGVDYVTTLRGNELGPHALITAHMHGNEICGAHAIAFFHEHGIRPARGQITLAFTNVAAYETFDRERPIDSRYLDEDMNRLWSDDILDGPRDSRELRRARELRTFVDAADYLLDLHAMENTGPPLVLAGLTDEALKLAQKIRATAYIVRDRGHLQGTRLRDYGPFSTSNSGRSALLVECGQREDPNSAKVASDVTLRFLASIDLISPEILEPGFLT